MQYQVLSMGSVLKRDEALSFLKEVLNASPYMSPEALSLTQLGDSNNYSLNIKEYFDSKILKEIAQKRHLMVKEEKNVTVVYSAKT